MDLKGNDGEGREFSSPEQLWEASKDGDGSHNSWYSKAVAYWDSQEASYDGVLGGLGFLSDYDIRDSRQLLLKVMKGQLEAAEKGARHLVAIDCGAGVGRVTEQLLLHHFQEVDLLEPSQHLLQTARKTFSAESMARRPKGSRAFPAGHHVAHYYCCGLQQHTFTAGRYDCIWLQWCLLYLTDEDLLALFARCRQGMQTDGVVFVKENTCKTGFVVDNADCSLTRSNAYFLALFERAGLKVLYNIKQRNFPKELFEVRMWALKFA